MRQAKKLSQYFEITLDELVENDITEIVIKKTIENNRILKAILVILSTISGFGLGLFVSTIML